MAPIHCTEITEEDFCGWVNFSLYLLKVKSYIKKKLLKYSLHLGNVKGFLID